MKTKHLLILTTALIFTMLVSSCKKQYDEGPRFSLKSPRARLEGTWELEKYKVDGVDLTQLYEDSCGCDISFTLPFDSDERMKLLNCNNNIENSCYLASGANYATFLVSFSTPFSIITPFYGGVQYKWYTKFLSSKKLIIETIISNVTYRIEAQKK